MVKRAVALVFCLLLLLTTVAAAATNETNKTVHVSLSEAKEESEEYNNTSTEENVESANSQTSEEIGSDTMGSKMISDGLDLWVTSKVDGMYASFQNSDVTEERGLVRGGIYTMVTYNPNPYKNEDIMKMFGDYYNLSIFLVVLFLLGEWAGRNLQRMSVTTVLGLKDITASKFYSGICLCFIAMFAQFIYMGLLGFIEGLSQFAMGSVLDSIAPDPSNLILYCMMAICDLLVALFFAVRYIVIYIVAVACSVIAVLLVPDFSRGFAVKTIGHILRILLLQPVVIFVTSIGILLTQSLPIAFQTFGQLGIILTTFLACVYMLFGNFDLVKKGVSYATTKGVIR